MHNLGWHFVRDDCRTGAGGILVTPGQTLTVAPPLVLCQNGLHFSRRAIDALDYAPGSVICRVQIGGDVLEPDGEDKGCCSERICLWMADASDTLRLLARQCALDVAHLGDMPPIVRRYLETGDDSIRAAALDAARASARDAPLASARAAARSATWAATRDAARSAARDAARSATWAATWDAARDAARSAARKVQNERLEALLLALAPEATS